MIGNLRGASRRHGTRLVFALCVFSSFAVAILSTAPAAAQSPPYFNNGRRWIGSTTTCAAPPAPAPPAPAIWSAQRLFVSSTLPGRLSDLCLYAWLPALPPDSTAVQTLLSFLRANGVSEVTEDVPVLFPSASFLPQEETYLTGLRNALRAHVGDASLLPSFPARPAVRVVVIDTARDAPHGLIHPGVSRHGDTLAHLIEDLVCLPEVAGRVRRCAAEVTTALALPWINSTGTVGPNGGYIGTLSDLARAIERAVLTWQQNRIDAPASTPARLLLNLSLGWEDTPKIADCSAGDPESMGPPARAVRGILQYAASQGALIVAAAGNDSGGKPARTGLVCPGRYQAVKRDADQSKSLLVAVSGVDYQDHPLETARPLGITGIAGLGLGVAWGASDPVPPQLTGSSVATAVTSAVSALVWAHQPTWTVSSVATAVYEGGVDVQGGLIYECPLLLTQCRSRRVSVCGALHAAGAQSSCSPAAAKPWSCPDLHVEAAALAATYAGTPLWTGMLSPPPSPALLPRFTTPTVQVQPTIFPMPISDSCRTCMVAQSFNSSDMPFLYIPALGQVPSAAVLAVRLAGDLPDDPPHTMGLTQLVSGQKQVFILPSEWIVQSAYITGLDAWGYSVTEQILVQQ